MKKLMIISCVIFLSFTVNAQKLIEKLESSNKVETLKLDLDFADEIKITTWNKSEISFKASISINNNEDNDVYELKTDKVGKNLIFKSEYNDLEKISKENITIKKGKDGSTITINNGWNIEIDAFYELFIPADLDLQIETISGDIIVKGHQAEMDLSSISGIIDVQIDQGAKVSIEVESIDGAVYTNHDYRRPDFSPKGLKYVFGGDVEFDLNGGGRTIHLETISGEVYIRK